MKSDQKQGTGKRPQLFGVSPIPGWYPQGERPIPADGLTIYNGGPVIECPQIYAGFWGSQWNQDEGRGQLSNSLQRFLTDLPNSGFMNVLSQYGVGAGAGMAGAFFQAHTLPVTGALTKETLEGWLQILIDFGHLPEPNPAGSAGATVVMIFLDETVSVNDTFDAESIALCFPDAAQPYTPDAFGFHWHLNTKAGHPLYYGVMACCSDDCLRESCPPGGSCSLSLDKDVFQRLAQISSHEFAEICTDPEPPTGWSIPFSGEIGDICNGCSDTINVRGNTYTVQKVYSRANDSGHYGGDPCSDGYCVASAPQPLMLHSGAPIPRMGFLAGYRPGHMDRLLPLPPIVVNPDDRSASIHDKEMDRYFRRLTYPLNVNHLPGNLAEHLRHLAMRVDLKMKGKNRGK